MSGHSKWSTIRHKKAARDQRRGKLFTKLIREITVAARQGGSDPESNPTLRTAVANAKAASMPNDNIDRAIKKGSGQLGGESYEEAEYEGYGPGGVAVMVRALTDNRNRTVSEVRHLFSKYGGNMGEPNSVAWMFDRRGVVEVEAEGAEEDRVLETALEAGADDVSNEGEVFEVLSSPEAFTDVREALEQANLTIRTAWVGRVPKSTVHLTGDPAASAIRLLEALEEHDDVQNVSSNLDIAPEELERLTAA